MQMDPFCPIKGIEAREMLVGMFGVDYYNEEVCDNFTVDIGEMEVIFKCNHLLNCTIYLTN